MTTTADRPRPSVIVRRAALAAAALGLAIAAVDPALAQGRPASVEVDTVRTVTHEETQPVIGRLVATTRSVLASRIEGIVGRVLVDVGDRVRRGAPIAELDRELLEIELATAEAAIDQAEALREAAAANVSLAEQSYERTRRLRGSAAFSQARFEDLSQELERARALFAEAEGRFANATSQLATAKYRLENATVLAPFDGVVIERHAQPGAYLSPGAAVVTVLDDRNLEIEADVPTELVAALAPGGAVELVLDDGTRHSARLRAVIPDESPQTRTRPARFRPALEETLKPLAAGQSATLMVPTAPPREVVSVAKDALVQQAGGWVVFTDEDGKAMPRPVEIGAAIGDRFEVVSGLEPGDVAVVRGNERLRPGQAIEYSEPDAEETRQQAKVVE